jgi:hypothetical protein
MIHNNELCDRYHNTLFPELASLITLRQREGLWASALRHPIELVEGNVKVEEELQDRVRDRGSSRTLRQRKEER